ncbi:hypothetical protein DP117_30500 [Brasilonema sp. UFV-L1]|nr:hypothetical protein [Brasilonema sp. UFV-L1]
MLQTKKKLNLNTEQNVSLVTNRDSEMSSYAKDFKGKSRNWFSKIQDASFEYITSMELGGILCKNNVTPRKES